MSPLRICAVQRCQAVPFLQRARGPGLIPRQCRCRDITGGDFVQPRGGKECGEYALKPPNVRLPRPVRCGTRRQRGYFLQSLAFERTCCPRILLRLRPFEKEPPLGTNCHIHRAGGLEQPKSESPIGDDRNSEHLPGKGSGNRLLREAVNAVANYRPQACPLHQWPSQP